MIAATTFDDIIRHFGGRERLHAIGARDLGADDRHVSFRLAHPNPGGVRSVVVTLEPNGTFVMNCYGPLTAETFTAQVVSGASGVIAENLATVLGRLTGIETLHHHHY